ncbi:MAG TPA: hypothetical protein PKM50_08265 [Methanoregula sp.]|nr:hypothetical protein [Methanoregula sp.]
MQKRILLPFLIISIVMILVSGCTDTNGSINTTSAPALKTAAPVANVTPDVTQVTTSAGSAVTPAPTLSQACSDLIPASAADREFLEYVDDNRIVTRINSLANDSCNKLVADKLKQQVITSPVPQTTILTNGRAYLLSATSYCQKPDAAAPDNTKSDLLKFEEKQDQYLDLLYSCHIEISQNASAVFGGEKLEMKSDLGPQTFTGNRNSVKKFRVTDGGYKFSATYSGFSNFTVHITNIYGKTVVDPFSTNGPYSGSATVNLSSGEYYMSIEASGPYILKMTQS